MKLNKWSLIPICSALTAAGAFIRIPIAPVPVTLQSFFVILSGILLGPRAGALSQIIYILVGLIGLPVFSGGGGISYVMKPTFGYLLGFVAASATAGYFMRKRPVNAFTVLIASALGMCMVYLVGTSYLAMYLYAVMQKSDAIGIAVKTGLLVFIPGDVIKCAVLALVVPQLRFVMGHLKKR
jgi:biotin transport system substrate-specific component